MIQTALLASIAVAFPLSVRFTDVVYDPAVAELIQRVSSDSVRDVIAGLSGEEAVTIAGERDSLPVRFAYSPGAYRAALWLSERLESTGLETHLVPFIPVELNDVKLLEAGEGWACGWNGHTWTGHGSGLLHTTDAGASWEAVPGIQGSVWQALAAISSDSVWVVDGKGRIVRTVDGLLWEERRFKGTGLYDVCAIGSRKGWAVGDTGTLLATDDAWETYSEDYVVPEGLRFVDFVSESKGWIASAQSLWVTDDAGENWTYLEHPLSEITGVSFRDSLYGYIVGTFTDAAGTQGAVYETVDGGYSWYPLVDTLTLIPRSIEIQAPDTLWIAGDGGLILVSADGGGTWARKTSPSEARLNALSFSADGKGAAVGMEEMLSSWDGEYWQRSDTANLGLMYNMVATLPGKDSTLVLITAHYDARSDSLYTYTPGADDNASGVACVLEAARVLSSQNPEHTLGFALFAGEEVGLFGSRRYVTEAAGLNKDILAVLNADMFAYDSNSDGAVDVNSNPLDPQAQAAGGVLMEVIETYGLDLVPRHYVKDARYNSDHYYFWQERIPAVFLGEDRNDFNPFYHTKGDRLNQLDPEHIRQGVCAAVGWMAVMANLDSLVGVEEKPVEPVEDIVALKLSSNILGSQGWLEVSSLYPATVSIYDASGRVAKSLGTVPSSQAPSRVSFNVSDLAAGVYWVRVEGNQVAESKKFIVIH